MTRVEIIPATAEHFKELHGIPPARTFIGRTALVDGEVAGIGGIYSDGEKYVAMLKVKDSMRKCRKSLYRACRDFIRESGVDVYAHADECIARSEAFIERLGFVKLKERIYVCPSTR